MLEYLLFGSLPKWLKGPVLKTGRGRKARESSNLSASAIFFEITPIIKLIYQSLQTDVQSVCLAMFLNFNYPEVIQSHNQYVTI